MSEGQRTTKHLQCIDCQAEFTFTAGEQQYFESRSFSEPKRCPDCRKAKKQRKAEEVMNGRR